MSFNRSGYIGRAPGDSAITIAKQYFQPTGVTTDFTFSSGYSPGLVDVYRNGIKLINVLDYAATDGSTISLSTPVGVGSTVQVVAYKAFNLATVKATELDTSVTGTDLTLSGDLTVSQTTTTVDINVSGAATVAGTLVANSFSGDGSALTGLANTDFIVSVATTTGNLNVSAAATITGATTLTGAVNIDATTDSTSTSTGALIVDGGVGIAKNVYIGAGLSVAGTLTYEDVTNVDSVGMVTAKSGVNVSGGELNVGLGFSVGNAGIITSTGGIIDLKNSGSVSNIKFYCESSNAHYTQLQSAAHSAYGGNVTLTLPTTTDTLIGKTTTDTLTNKTLTSPTLTTPVFSGAATGELKVGSGITIAATSGVATFADGSSTANALKFGSGGDFGLYHNGSQAFVNNSTGNLSVQSSGNIWIENQAGSKVYIKALADTAVELYYNNSKKFETTNDGTVTTGIGTFTAGLEINADNKRLKFGVGDDLNIYSTGTNGWVYTPQSGADLYMGTNAGEVYIQTGSGGNDTAIKVNSGGSVELNHSTNKKFETTNDGVKITGIATCSNGLDTVGMLRESYNTVANKLSAAPNIDVFQGMVHYFTTQETTTATPNLRYTSTQALNDFMSAGDAITVTIITTAAAGGYSANWTIDGSAVTEEWVGGAAPTAGGADGYDIYTANVLKLADASWKVFINLVNAT